jgi:hypothetical protein
VVVVNEEREILDMGSEIRVAVGGKKEATRSKVVSNGNGPRIFYYNII